MSNRVRTISIGLLLGALLLSGLVSLSVVAQQGPPPNGAPGARQALGAFQEALRAGDLVLLKAGGALSGTVSGDQFTVQTTSGKAQTLARANIALMSFGDKTDQLILTTGDLVNGFVQIDSLSITLPTGAQVSIPKSQIATTVFKLNLPEGGPSSGQNRQFFRLFRSLAAQNLFALFAKSMTSYDLAIFPGPPQPSGGETSNEVLSGKIVNTQIIFNSALFGKLTFKVSDVASIQLAAAGASAGSDIITLKTGDRLTGTLDDANAIQFQLVAVTDAQGQPVTITFKHGDVSQIIFRLPASAFGGGKGPGFQGGPGR